MTIEVECPGCHKKIKAPDKFAGKTAKCPGCKAVIHVPAAGDTPKPTTSAGDAQKAATAGRAPAEQKPATTGRAPAEQKPASVGRAATRPAPAKQPAAKKPAPAPAVAEEEWYVQTEEEQQYGPVTKDELDEWVADHRVDASCQLLKEGWPQWKWAEEVYPELAEAVEEAVEENPFAGLGEAAAPAAGVVPFTPEKSDTRAAGPTEHPEGEAAVSATARRALQQTRPWVLFLSILGFIGTVGNAISTLGFFIMGIMAMVAAGAAGLFFIILALAIGGIAAIQGIAFFHLFQYASAIGAFGRTKEGRDLDRALESQKSFWKLVGILTIVGLASFVILMILGMLLGGAAMMAVGGGGSPPPAF